MNALVSIVMAANRSTMIISSYSFTLAIIGVVGSCGTALGSMFGPILTNKLSIFSVTNLSNVYYVILIYVVYVAYFFMFLFICFYILDTTCILCSYKHIS